MDAPHFPLGPCHPAGIYNSAYCILGSHIAQELRQGNDKIVVKADNSPTRWVLFHPFSLGGNFRMGSETAQGRTALFLSHIQACICLVPLPGSAHHSLWLSQCSPRQSWWVRLGFPDTVREKLSFPWDRESCVILQEE